MNCLSTSLLRLFPASIDIARGICTKERYNSPGLNLRLNSSLNNTEPDRLSVLLIQIFQFIFGLRDELMILAGTILDSNGKEANNSKRAEA